MTNRLELREQWAEKLHDFAPGTESFASFCRTRGLNYQNASNWRRKLGIGDFVGEVDFAEVSFPAPGGGDFILRRSGWEILVPALFSEQTLRRILAALGEA